MIGLRRSARAAVRAGRRAARVDLTQSLTPPREYVVRVFVVAGEAERLAGDLMDAGILSFVQPVDVLDRLREGGFVLGVIVDATSHDIAARLARRAVERLGGTVIAVGPVTS